MTKEVLSGPTWVLAGFLFFGLCNQILRGIFASLLKFNPVQSWKFKNTAVSFIHSLITGTWALYCFYEHPKLGEDLINTYTPSSHILVSISVGYFIHDFLDMALNHRKRSSYELMGHHACVITCFGLAVWTSYFIGYAVVALFVEVNSVFLHIRQMFIVSGVSKREYRYRLNSMVNIGTFVVFRITVLGWMTRWIVLHKDNLSLPVYTLGSVGLAIVMLMNIILFFRICIMDFSKNKHKESNVGSNQKRMVVEVEDKSKTQTTNSLIHNTHNLHIH